MQRTVAPFCREGIRSRTADRYVRQRSRRPSIAPARTTSVTSILTFSGLGIGSAATTTYVLKQTKRASGSWLNGTSLLPRAQRAWTATSALTSASTPPIRTPSPRAPIFSYACWRTPTPIPSWVGFYGHQSHVRLKNASYAT